MRRRSVSTSETKRAILHSLATRARPFGRLALRAAHRILRLRTGSSRATPRLESIRTCGGLMKVLVVDDHPLVLSAMTQLLGHVDRPLTIYGAADRDETYALLAGHPDIALVLLDLALPGMRGLEMLGRLRRDFPRLPIAVLSATHDRQTVDSALAAGARGFIAKTAKIGRASCRERV